MDRNDAWSLFENTGSPDAYLIYKYLDGGQGRLERENEEDAFLQIGLR